MGRRKKELSPLNEFEQELLSQIVGSGNIEDAIKPLMKRLIEASLGGELDDHLLKSKSSSSDSLSSSNRRNGYGSKVVRTSVGDVEIDTPRDRDASFEPILVPKGENQIADGISSKIIKMYESGVSYEDIRENIQDLYGTDVSVGTISKVTDSILSEISDFKQRPLERLYPVIFMDAMFFKVRNNGHVERRAIYTLLGVTIDGKKDILGLYSAETEGAKMWSAVMADMKARGIEDILIACIDNLTGFQEAIESHFPKCKVQLCIVHQIRNSLKYVASKHQKEFMNDLKLVYRASSKENAENALLDLEEKWGEKYNVVLRSWQNNWEALSEYFQYSKHIRKMIYTTNPVEGLHRMVRKYTKSKAAFTSQNALEKQVFCAYKKALKKWTMPVQNWALIISELDLVFGDRLVLTIR